MVSIKRREAKSSHCPETGEELGTKMERGALIRGLAEASEEARVRLATLIPPDRCRDDATRLKQIRLLAEYLGISLPLEPEYGPYLERLSFSLITIPSKDVEFAWSRFLTGCRVNIHPLTNKGIARWYQDIDQPFHALTVHDHFFRQLEEEELDFDLHEVVWSLTEAARDYATLTAMCAVQEHVERHGEKARQDLQQRHGEHFAVLSEEARHNLTKANAVLTSLVFEGWPELVPFYYQKAIECEFNRKVYPRIKSRLPRFEPGVRCSQSKCNKLKPYPSLTLDQLFHYLKEHHGGSMRSREQDRCLETLRCLGKSSGLARHGQPERYTRDKMHQLLSQLRGDARVIECLSWLNLLR